MMIMERMSYGLALPALLSQALVAFTIEFDNEAEHRMPHWTTNFGSARKSRSVAWLVSMVMWSNCMRFVTEQGISVRELEARAKTPTNLHGMQRWGYITISPDKIIRATSAGRNAQEIWRPLFGEIEDRWRTRFGDREIEHLLRSLSEVNARIKLDLPDCMPILHYGLFSHVPQPKQSIHKSEPELLSLAALLSRVLLAFAIEFERESALSIAISANVLRILGAKGSRIRDLPLLSGVSKESIAMAMGILTKGLFSVLEPDPAARSGKAASLTPKGLHAQALYFQLLDRIEESWRARFGAIHIDNLRDSFNPLMDRLFEGLEPYPDGWRAAVHKPKTLPHFPMVLHRGGFPDGS